MSEEQRKNEEIEVEGHHHKKYLANDEAAEDSEEVEADDEVEAHLQKYN
ncbi:MAG TPA: hypothetical protein VE985_05170 [Gaiellaceae bacterium]|nr:hypothetical protein [Gaiellaceae bacterium]